MSASALQAVHVGQDILRRINENRLRPDWTVTYGEITRSTGVPVMSVGPALERLFREALAPLSLPWLPALVVARQPGRRPSLQWTGRWSSGLEIDLEQGEQIRTWAAAACRAMTAVECSQANNSIKRIMHDAVLHEQAA
jgi:hypothetical protein